VRTSQRNSSGSLPIWLGTKRVTCRVRAREWTAPPETQVDPIADVAYTCLVHPSTDPGRFTPLWSCDGDRRHSMLGCPVRSRTPRGPASRGRGPATRKGKGERKPRVLRAERPRRRALPTPRSELRGGGAPPCWEMTPVLWGQERSCSEDSRCAPKQPSGSAVPDAWCGSRYPHGWSVADLADPGYSPVPKSRHPLVPGTIPAEVAAHWECRLLAARSASASSSGLVVAPEQRPRSRVSAPRP
jgi:hypothetical protein